MKKLTAILLALLLPLTFAAAEEAKVKSVTYSFEANETTGYSWTAFVLGGDSVEVSSGVYESDPNPDMLDGVGGRTWYTLTPVKPGASVVMFNYTRGWENDCIDKRVLLADVDQELNLFVTDITNSGVFTGSVIAVNEEDHSVLMETESLGQFVARFDEDMSLPVVDEQITIYTNGTMTMSLPAIMNVIAWETVPNELAR